MKNCLGVLFLCFFIGVFNVALGKVDGPAYFEIGPEIDLKLTDFQDVVFRGKKIKLSKSAIDKLDETRVFVSYLLEKNIKVYGLTTGFADLRNYAVTPQEAGTLSHNIIESHDAGIGDALPKEVTLGAMLLRANALAKGNSAFSKESLQTLIDMINSRIIPAIPSTGSLGASGDLAFLARLGRAMQGEDVAVYYNGEITTAKKALARENIETFSPKAKEGLALTNGTPFMTSMIAIAYLKELHEFENILALQGMFLNAVNAIDAAFTGSIQNVRNATGQRMIAEYLSRSFLNSPFIDRQDVQNDYSIRCLPQILGPKLEVILNQYNPIRNELNAVTDNPLLFKDNEITSDVGIERLIDFNGSKWAVLSGGNFHGENIATIADSLAMANAKIALLLERQMTYLLNPARNKKLPVYLIANTKKAGLLSGYMITQYTANALAQKIAQLGEPVSVFNISSANESEDVVSYGATAAQKLLNQLDLIHQLNTVYLTTVLQAYAISRENILSKGGKIPSDITSEQIYQLASKNISIQYPTTEDMSFDSLYKELGKFLNTAGLRSIISFPLLKEIGIEENCYFAECNVDKEDEKKLEL